MSSDIIITTLEIPVGTITTFKNDLPPSGNFTIQRELKFDQYGTSHVVSGDQDLDSIYTSMVMLEDPNTIGETVFNIRVRVKTNQTSITTQDLLNVEAVFKIDYPDVGIGSTVLEATNVSDEGNGSDMYFDLKLPLSLFISTSTGTYNGLLNAFHLNNETLSLPETINLSNVTTTTRKQTYYPAHYTVTAGDYSVTVPVGMEEVMRRRIAASFTTLVDFLFDGGFLTASLQLTRIEKMSPMLSTSFGFLKSSGSVVTFDELRQSSSTSTNSVSAVISLLQKILVNLFSDKGSNRFNTQMGTALFSVLGYSITETDLLKELTLAVSNTEQIILAEQIGETALSNDEKLKSLRVTSVNINVDVATVKIRVQTEAGTVLTYPITL